MQLPTVEEVRARAERDGLIEPGADLPARLRKTVANTLLEEKQAAAAPRPPELPATAEKLLSRFTYETLAGTIRVDVFLTPHPERPDHGRP